MEGRDYRRNVPAIIVKDKVGNETSVLFSISLKSPEHTVKELGELLGQLMETGDEVCALGSRVFLPNGQIITDVHSEEQCVGRGCSIHHPSQHHMLALSQVYLYDRMLMMRVCPHGVRHPDPDDKSFHLEAKDGFDLAHGCCAHQCCENRPKKAK